MQRKALRVEAGPGLAPGLDRRFVAAFRIGRGEGCELRLRSPMCSREHARVELRGDTWWVTDLDTANGLLVDDREVREAPLREGSLIQVGRGGPMLKVSLVSEDELTEEEGGPRKDLTPPVQARPSVPPRPAPPGQEAAPSMTRIMDRYFGSTKEPAGDHTMMVRQAYKKVRGRERRWFFQALGAVAVLLVVALGVTVWQRGRLRQLQGFATEIFLTLRRMEVRTSELRRAVERTGGSDLDSLLAQVDADRNRLAQQYEGYIGQLGTYRKLGSEEERLIYQVVRTFGESEFAVDAGFVREIQDTIRQYWAGRGRERFRVAIRRAERGGYTEEIAATLKATGLPVDFFFLALQESDFIPDRAGPLTRWGRAKGMWQFIPKTANLYGLETGVNPDGDLADPLDQRLSWPAATTAAARYLRDLHGMLTQSSGLLVMASYNWGEHRVIQRLDSLTNSRDAFAAAFKDVPQDPVDRNYWKFLKRYGDRIPAETKDYVLKIVSAAVVGRNPRLFGFDFDDPLAKFRP